MCRQKLYRQPYATELARPLQHFGSYPGVIMTVEPTPPVPTGHRREIVSYVRQRARMTPAQHRAWMTLRGDYLVDVQYGIGHGELAPGQDISWSEVFGRTAPLIVEIGSGSGDSLVAMAADHPDCNVIAFEVFEPGLASTMIKLERAGVTNARLVAGNGIHGLAQLIDPSSLSEIWVFFPDPWPKSKHRKRRLVNAEFAGLAADRLRPGGVLRTATDWAEYANHMRKVLDAQAGLRNNYPDGWAPRPANRVETHFEGRGRSAGHLIYDLEYQRP